LFDEPKRGHRHLQTEGHSGLRRPVERQNAVGEREHDQVQGAPTHHREADDRQVETNARSVLEGVQRRHDGLHVSVERLYGRLSLSRDMPIV
jgi:hypothetical protein